MKQQLKFASLAVGMLGALGLTSSVAFAQDSSNTTTTAQEQKTMRALAAKTEALEKQLMALQQQIIEMKKAQAANIQSNNAGVPSTSKTVPQAQLKNKKAQQVASVLQAPQQNVDQNQASSQNQNASQNFTPATPEYSPSYPQEPISIHTIKRPEGEVGAQTRYYPMALTANDKILTYIAGTPVVTSPYLGARPAFDGSDLIAYMSSINQDLRLMQQRDLIEQQYKEEGYPAPNVPILMLSGTVQPLMSYGKPFSGSTSGNMTLSSAELDTTALINPWVEGFVSFTYGSSAPAQGGDVTSNSSVSVSKAFVNIGNLDKTPYYLSAGQMYVPFGQYSSFMVSSPLTSIVGKTQVIATAVGYAPQEDTGLYGTLFGYNSDTNLDNTAAGGGNLVFTYGGGDTSGNLGVSLISNIADSTGMQNTGGSSGQFGGFGVDSSTEAVSQVPGYDIHGVFNTGPFTFIGEFVSATEAFDTSALSFNGSGAQPMALQGEAAYTFKMMNKPSALAVGYGWSGQALGLQIPQQSFSTTLNISWWRDTLFQLEYKHDLNYAASDYAAGIGSTENITGTGTDADTISALFAIYF